MALSLRSRGGLQRDAGPARPAGGGSEATPHRDGLTRLLLTTTLSVYGGWFSTIALIVLAYRLTGQPAAPAALVALRLLARFVGALPGGVLADRRGANVVVALCAGAQAVLLAGVDAAFELGTVWPIYLAVVVGQAAAGMAQSANGALVAQVVAEPDRGRANALVSTLMSSSILVGPGAAGLLLAVTGPVELIAVNVVTSIAVVVLALRLPVRRRAAAPAERSDWSLGIRIVARDPFLRAFALAWWAECVAVGAAQGVFVTAAAERFGHDGLVGGLYAAVGAGAIVGGAVALRLHPARTRGTTVLGISLVACVAIALFAVSPTLWTAAICLAVAGALAGVYQPWGMTETQRRVDGAVCGRVMGTIVTLQFSGTLVGSIGALTLLLGMPWASVQLIACAVAAFAILALSPLCRERRDAATAIATAAARA